MFHDDKYMEELFAESIGRRVEIRLPEKILYGTIVNARSGLPFFVQVKLDNGETEELYLDHALALARDGLLDLGGTPPPPEAA